MNITDQVTAFNAEQKELQRQRAQLGDDAARIAGELAVARQHIILLTAKVEELTKALAKEKQDDP